MIRVPTDSETMVHRPSTIDNAQCYHNALAYLRCVKWMYGTTVSLAAAQEQGLRPCKRCFRAPPMTESPEVQQ